MTLPPLHLHPMSLSHYYTSGDVTIDAGAAIAPGVLLQADPESRLVIRAGACIGIGAVLHAHGGVIEVGEGANIGAEVLLIGQVAIGRRACVGSGSTLLNCTIGPGQIVPPGSLIGDLSRPEPPSDELRISETVLLPPDMSQAAEPTQGDANPPAPPPDTTEPSPSMNVYGQVYVNQLLVKMFPNTHRPGNANQAQVEPPASLPDDPWDD